MTEAELASIEAVGRESGVDPKIVLATGRTRLAKGGDGAIADASRAPERATG